MREHGVPQFTVDAHRPVGRLRRARRLASPPSSATPTCSPRSTSPASRCTAADRGDDAPARRRRAGTRRSTPSRSPTSSTPPCSATARRPCWRITEHRPGVEGAPGARAAATGCCCGWPPTGGVYVPRFYDVDYLPDGRIQRVAPNRPGVPWRGAPSTPLMDLDEWPYPKKPLVPLAETVHERLSVEIFRGCTRGCRFCQAGMITRPVRERSHHERSARWSRTACATTGFEEVGLLSLSQRRPLRDRRDRQGPRRPLRGHATSALSLPSAPASTRSTSTWPTSCRATAAAPG